MMKRLFAVATVALLTLYPIFIYFGLQKYGISIIAGALALVFLVRLAFLWFHKKVPGTLPVYVTILGASLAITAAFFKSMLALKLYPVAVNTACLIAFSLSLYKPPSAIELFARMADKNFPEEAVPYTRQVTILWCIFFIVNGSIALWTALGASIETWTIYNGFVSYCAIGVLMAGEWVYRQFKIKKAHTT